MAHKPSKGERITAPHLVPEIWELEKQFYALWNPKKIVKQISTDIGIAKFAKAIDKPTSLYRSDGSALTPKEVVELEGVISRALGVPIAEVRGIILKSAIVTKMAGKTLMGQPVKINLSELPATIQGAIKKNLLTAREINAVKHAFIHAAENITNVQQRAKHQIKMMLLDGMANKTPHRVMESQLMERMAEKDMSVLNYDWERVVVTETNDAANNAYLGGISDGDYVIGNSHDDACPYCLRDINLKVYKVTDFPPPDPRDLLKDSPAYKTALHRWKTEVWVGKNNVGRSVSPRKRTPKGLVPRDPSEMTMPTLAYHVFCRCRWSAFLPDLYYIKDNRVEFATDKESKIEQKKWLKDNPHVLTGGIE